MQKQAIVKFCGLAVFGFFMAGSGDGHSDTLPGMAGHAWNHADAGCFTSGWSAVTNSACGNGKKLLIPVQSRANGAVNFRATPTVSTPPGFICVTYAQCRAIVTSPSNGFIAQTPVVSVCSNGPVAVSLGTLTVASTSVAHYDCDFMAGASLASVTF